MFEAGGLEAVGFVDDEYFGATGFSEWVGSQVDGLEGVPVWGIVLIVLIVVGVVLTVLMTKTATSAALFPILGAVAVGLGIVPLLMTVAVTLAVSSALMLPPGYSV